ncbi:hypothetical protein C8Q79DRAFT_99557 [Trametes meyenii]|nr:hypothetical protein C8Q79DRAFT_99557 [Trametes meyenii]
MMNPLCVQPVRNVSKVRCPYTPNERPRGRRPYAALAGRARMLFPSAVRARAKMTHGRDLSRCVRGLAQLFTLIRQEPNHVRAGDLRTPTAAMTGGGPAMLRAVAGNVRCLGRMLAPGLNPDDSAGVRWTLMSDRLCPASQVRATRQASPEPIPLTLSRSLVVRSDGQCAPRLIFIIHGALATLRPVTGQSKGYRQGSSNTARRPPWEAGSSSDCRLPTTQRSPLAHNRPARATLAGPRRT